MTQNINIFSINDFDPHRNSNHLSVDKEGNLHYADKRFKPSKLSAVRDAAFKVLNNIETTDRKTIEQNVQKLNEKIEKHNSSKIARLFNSVGKVVQIFKKRWGENLIKYYQIDIIQLPQDSTKPDTPAEQTDGTLAIQTGDASKDSEEFLLGSTETLKIKPYDSESDEGDTDSEISDEEDTGTNPSQSGSNSAYGTFEVNDTGGNTGIFAKIGSFILQRVLGDDTTAEDQPEIIETHFENGPSWGKSFKTYEIPSASLYDHSSTNFEPTLRTVNSEYYIETYEQKGKEDELCLLKTSTKTIQKAFVGEGVNFLTDSGSIPIESTVNDEPICFPIFNENIVKYNTDLHGNLNIYNKSVCKLKVLSATDTEPKEYPAGETARITKNGTYLCWLDDEKETGFFVTRR
jgi:hypothetical protein